MGLGCAEARAARFQDALGREVVLEKPPQRIVALAPSLTEILYALGLGERVVGVTAFSDYPPQASHKPKVGSYARVNVEQVLSLNPDLVLATKDGNKPRTVRLLERAGIPIFVVNPRNVRQALETISSVAAICGAAEAGRRLEAGLRKRMEAVQHTIQGLALPLVFLQINIQPIMSVNRNTFHHDVIRLAGGKNMTADAVMTYPRIGIEEVIRRKPEVIIISSMERGGRFLQARTEWLKWPAVPAARHGRVYLMDSDLLDRPSPRLIQGLEIMARLLHPSAEWN